MVASPRILCTWFNLVSWEKNHELWWVIPGYWTTLIIIYNIIYQVYVSVFSFSLHLSSLNCQNPQPPRRHVDGPQDAEVVGQGDPRALRQRLIQSWWRRWQVQWRRACSGGPIGDLCAKWSGIQQTIHRVDLGRVLEQVWSRWRWHHIWHHMASVKMVTCSLGFTSPSVDLWIPQKHVQCIQKFLFPQKHPNLPRHFQSPKGVRSAP